MLIFMDYSSEENIKIIQEISSHLSEKPVVFHEEEKMFTFLKTSSDKPQVGLFFIRDLAHAKMLIQHVHNILEQEQLLMYNIGIVEKDLKDQTHTLADLIETLYAKPVEILDILKEIKKNRQLLDDFNKAMPVKLDDPEKVFPDETKALRYELLFNDELLGLKEALASIKQSNFPQELHSFYTKWKDNIVWPGKSVITNLKKKEVMFLDKDFDYREISEENFEVCAKNLGLVQLRYSQLEFFPLLDIAKDLMQAYVLVFPLEGMDNKQAFKHYFDMLSDSHVTFGILGSEFEQMYQKCLEAKTVAYFKIAQGQEPVNGHPAYCELLIQKEEMAGKITDEKGTIDYREHNKVINVKKGEPIATYIPAKEPVDGYRVNSDGIKALLSNPTGFQMGENIVLDEEKSVFVAELDGMLVFEKKIVHLKDTLVIQGNVNLKTGNIHSAKNVIIHGDVEADMVVEAKGNILIKGTIEDARIVAGGHIEAHGFTGSGKTWVFANGHIDCDFVQQSHLESKGSITFHKYCVNSQLFSGDKVLGDDKSKLIGGEIHAVNGMELFEVGNNQETVCKIILGADSSQEKVLEKIANRVKTLQDEKKQILGILKEMVNIQQPLKPQLAKLPKPQVARFVEEMKLLKNKQELEKKLTVYLEEQKMHKKDNKAARLVIHHQIFPGNELSIDSAHKKLKDKYSHGVFFFQPGQSEIIFAAQ